MTSGLSSVYGPSDAEILRQAQEKSHTLWTLPWLRPFPRNAFFYKGEVQIVDYPPLSMIVLRGAGGIYRLLAPSNDASNLFNVAINIPPLLFSIGLVWLLSRTGELGTLRAFAFWMNPAVLLGSVLGYQDFVFGFFAVGACLCLQKGRMVFGTSLVILSGLLKPQGSLLLPTLLALLFVESSWKTRLCAFLAAAATATVVFAPWLATGHLISALDGSRRPLEEATVSAESLNLGWIGGWVLQWIHEKPFPLARILTLQEFESWAGWDALPVSRCLLLAFTLLNVLILIRSRREDRVPLSLVLQAHLYAFFGTSVHENHTYLAVFVAPLLLGVYRRGAAVLAMTSTFLFLNLFLLEGLGRGIISDRKLYHWRLITGIDFSVITALAHVGLVAILFVWAFERIRRDSQDAGR